MTNTTKSIISNNTDDESSLGVDLLVSELSPIPPTKFRVYFYILSVTVRRGTFIVSLLVSVNLLPLQVLYQKVRNHLLLILRLTQTAPLI